MHICFRRGRDVSGGACDRTLQANEGEAAEADYSLRRGTRPKRTNDPPKRTGLVGSHVVPRYQLQSSLVEATTPAMLAELEQAYSMEEPFVFLAWSPHWMNQEYEFRYLSDPKNAMGSVDAPQTLHSVTREGFAENETVAYALINAMRLDEDQIGSLELAINEAEDPEAGVRRWLEEKKNRELVQPWIEVAKNAQEE
jgi:glycine betaine/proline transport system substrate-binding protein